MAIDYTKLVRAAYAAGMTAQEIASKFSVNIQYVEEKIRQYNEERGGVPPSPDPQPDQTPPRDEETPPPRPPRRDPGPPPPPEDEGSRPSLARRVGVWTYNKGKRGLKNAAGRGLGYLDEEFGVLARPVTRMARRRLGIETEEERIRRERDSRPAGQDFSGSVKDVIKKVDDVLARVEDAVRKTVDQISDKLSRIDRREREDELRTRENDQERGPPETTSRSNRIAGTAAAGGVAGALAGGAAALGLSQMTGESSTPEKEPPLPWDPGGVAGKPPEPVGSKPAGDSVTDPSKDMTFEADTITFDADEIVFTKPIGGPTGYSGAFGSGEGGQELGGPGGYGGADPRQYAGGGSSSPQPSSAPRPKEMGGGDMSSRLTSPDRMGDGRPDPEYKDGFTKTDQPDKFNAVSTRRVGIGTGGPIPGEQGSYSGKPSNSAETMLRSIMTAETGSEGSMLDERRFIRTQVTPEQNQGRHSSAYGPVQMTKGYLEDFKSKHGDSLPPEEREYLDRLIEQNAQMLKTSKSGDYSDPVYGFGGKGTTGDTLRDRQLYGQIAQRSIVNLAHGSSSYDTFIKSFRGADDRAYFDKIAREARKQGKTPEQLFQELKSMRVEDVPSLPQPGLRGDQLGRALSPDLTPGPSSEPAGRIGGSKGSITGPDLSYPTESPIKTPGSITGPDLSYPTESPISPPPAPEKFDSSRFNGRGEDLQTKMSNMSLKYALERKTRDGNVQPTPDMSGDDSRTPSTTIERDDDPDREPPSTSLSDHFEEGFPGLGKRSRHSGLGM